MLIGMDAGLTAENNHLGKWQLRNYRSWSTKLASGLSIKDSCIESMGHRAKKFKVRSFIMTNDCMDKKRMNDLAPAFVPTILQISYFALVSDVGIYLNKLSGM